MRQRPRVPEGNRRPNWSRVETWLRAEPRPLPAVRVARTTLRTAHLIAVASLYGGHVYGVEAGRLVPALVGSLTTGGALMALEVYRVPVWMVQIRGVATLVKLLLVAGVAAFWDQRVALLSLALVIGAVVSHMPGRWRYHSLLHGRVVGPQDKG
jgi:hypothetical protein